MFVSYFKAACVHCLVKQLPVPNLHVIQTGNTLCFLHEKHLRKFYNKFFIL